jgi:hypothetical protein
MDRDAGRSAVHLRENQALARRLHAAKLKGTCVEEIDYCASRGRNKSVIRALAQRACRDGCSALYTRAAALFRGLAIARADGSLRSLLTRLNRIDMRGEPMSKRRSTKPTD